MSASVEPASVPEQDELSVEWLAAALGRPGALRSFTATPIGTGQVGHGVNDVAYFIGAGLLAGRHGQQMLDLGVAEVLAQAW